MQCFYSGNLTLFNPFDTNFSYNISIRQTHASYRLRALIPVCSLRARFSRVLQLLCFYKTSMNFVTECVCQVASLSIKQGFVSGG